eukprot:TRINITY_DN25279_c0_g1_i1.p1 TRINITY_DN25279_c0_g1~~TRINITY_DN25279_c0_g1_i1.p1  ORF type:complete len:122 (+),score=14.46 TRINITY_DN25279_c0_g1_i1:37-402(+)
MSGSVNFGEVSIHVLSQSLTLIGQCIALVSVVCLGELVFKIPRKIIFSIPKFIGYVQIESEKPRPERLREISSSIAAATKNYTYKVLKLQLILLCGLGLRAFGNTITPQAVISLTNKIIKQ